MLRLPRDAGNLRDGGQYLVQRCHEVSPCGKALRSMRENDGPANAPQLVVREVAAGPMAFVVAMLLARATVMASMLRFFISEALYSLPSTFQLYEMNV